MRPIVLLAIFSFALTVAGLAALAPPLAVLGSFGLAYVGIAYLTVPSGRAISAERTVLPLRPRAGERITVKVTLRSNRRIFAQALDPLPTGVSEADIDGDTAFAGSISGEAAFTYSFEAKRGPTRFGDLSCILRGPVFAASRIVELPCSSSVATAPREPKPIDVRLSTRKTLAYSGSIASRTAGSGDEFFLVREYRAGDALKRVNWRRSAYGDQLFVNDFERRRNADIGFVLDTRIRHTSVPGRDEDQDAYAELELALANEFARQGHRLSHMTFGVPYRWVTPGHGKAQANRIADALALAEPSDPASIRALAEVPDTVFPHQSIMFLFLNLLGDEERAVRALVSKGYRVAVVTSTLESGLEEATASPSAIALARYAREAEIAALRATGAIVHEYDPSLGLDRTALDLSRSLAMSARTGSGSLA
jgi:uncharacterized protein (DUF58 family)